jgi:hypothetical protein
MEVELTGFCGSDEAVVDDDDVRDAAPQALQDIAAIKRQFPAPLTFGIATAQPLGHPSDRLGALGLVKLGIERAVDRQRLEQCGVVTLGSIGHQGADTPGMVDQRLEIAA